MSLFCGSMRNLQENPKVDGKNPRFSSGCSITCWECVANQPFPRGNLLHGDNVDGHNGSGDTNMAVMNPAECIHSHGNGTWRPHILDEMARMLTWPNMIESPKISQHLKICCWFWGSPTAFLDFGNNCYGCYVQCPMTDPVTENLLSMCCFSTNFNSNSWQHVETFSMAWDEGIKASLRFLMALIQRQRRQWLIFTVLVSPKMLRERHPKEALSVVSHVCKREMSQLPWDKIIISNHIISIRRYAPTTTGTIILMGNDLIYKILQICFWARLSRANKQTM